MSSEAARAILSDPSSSTVGLCEAAKKLVGDGYLLWEPETTWTELHRLGVEIPDACRNKLMAVVALSLVPSFYWDAVVFEKTALAMDGQPVLPEVLQEATPAQLAWATEEAAWVRRILGDPPVEFMHEPAAYAAVVLDRAGFAAVPRGLSFASDEFKNRIRDEALAAEVSRQWASLDKGAISSRPYQETPTDVQLARLAGVELHVRERWQRASADLARLR